MTAHVLAPRLGRTVQHDPRSLAFPAIVDGVTIKSRTWRHYGPVLDQGNVGSCTGNAMAQALNTKPLKRPLRRLDEAKAVELYSLATQLDGYPGVYPPTDTGSSGLAVAKAAKQLGYISEYRHAFGLEHALAALMGGPVLLGTNWYESMFTPGVGGRVIAAGSVAGGHEFLLIGVDVPNRIVTCLNSWSVQWGDKGRFRMTFDTLDQLLREQGDATVPLR